jgi:hypothetical protein
MAASMALSGDLKKVKAMILADSDWTIKFENQARYGFHALAR